MLFTYKKPSQEVIDEIREIADKYYPNIIPESAKEPVVEKILAEHCITEPTEFEVSQAVVVFNYQASGRMKEILDSKYHG